MTENKLPPYHVATPELNDIAYPMPFDHFARHHSLPVALRRDYYNVGDRSGLFYHVDFFALYIVRSGTGVHWIDSYPYALTKGDAYLMAPGAAHEFSRFTELEIDCFFFQTALFGAEELAALRECPGFRHLFSGDLNMEHRIHLRPEDWRTVEIHVETMRNEWGEPGRAGALLLKNELFHLLVKLARLLELSKPVTAHSGKERRPDSALAETLQFCDEHFDKPLSVARLAARVFLSPGHFSELFIREVGMPPATYIRCVRMEKARVLLRETETPVAQIAKRCGFPNGAQFSRAFRNFYNYSPLQYRKSTRGPQQSRVSSPAEQ